MSGLDCVHGRQRTICAVCIPALEEAHRSGQLIGRIEPPLQPYPREELVELLIAAKRLLGECSHGPGLAYRRHIAQRMAAVIDREKKALGVRE